MTVILLNAPEGAMPQPAGSGVWIGKHGYIVTCWHVIASSRDSFKIGISNEPYVVAEGKNNFSVMGAVDLIDVKLLAQDEDIDVAILKADQTPEQVHLQPTVAFAGPGKAPVPLTPQTPISPIGATLETEFPERGETMLLAGFPLGQNALFLQTGVATGFFSNRKTPNSPPSSALRIMLSLVSNPGNSGGPVLDAGGKVIGLLQGNLLSPMPGGPGGLPLVCSRPKLGPDGNPLLDSGNPIPEKSTWCQQNSGISLAVPAKFVADLAKKNNIDLN